MENTPERRQDERRKENKLIAFQDRRVQEWRRAADRAEHAGEPVKAQMFRNTAWAIEQENIEGS